MDVMTRIMYKMVNGHPYTLTNMSDRLALGGDGGMPGGGNKNKYMIIKTSVFSTSSISTSLP